MPRKPGEQSSTTRRLKENKTYNAVRPKRHEFYNTARWQKLRAWFRGQHPLCQECERQGRVNPSKIVDHIVSIEDGGDMTSADNLQALCVACHNRKHFKASHSNVL
jgi:5-methylcytosine-specific restriction protein A